MGLPLLPPHRPGVRPRLLLLTLVLLTSNTPLVVPSHSMAPTPKNARLMSVVLLELPRNLIALEDPRLTRNNSLTSLASIGGLVLAAPASLASTTTVEPTHSDPIVVVPSRPQATPVLESVVARDLIRDLPIHLFFSDDDLEIETPQRQKRGNRVCSSGSHPVVPVHAPSPPLVPLKEHLFVDGHQSPLPREFSPIERRQSIEDDPLPPLALRKRNKQPPKNTIQQLILKRKLIHSVELGLSPLELRFITAGVSELGKKTYLKLPVMTLLTSKNKLIRQLNQKWNKVEEQENKDDRRLSRKRRWLDESLVADGEDNACDDVL